MYLVCIQAKSSIDFVKQVFNAYETEQFFAIADCNNAQEFEDSRGIVADDFIATLPGGGWLENVHLGSDSASPAQIVFTSGTEGKPRAIVLSHGGLKNVVDRINASMELDDSVAEYIGVPVYHSFGLGRCRAVSNTGGRAYIPENGFDLAEIKQMLESGQINALSAVPSLLRILLDNTVLFEPVADRLKWIEIGSQYMSADEKLRLRNLFPQAKIVQHYGLTEASRTSLLRIDQVPEHLLESVGEVHEHEHEQIALSITGDGRLRIKGPHVALGLMVNNEITPIVDQQEYFETSDLAEIKEGYLYFKGRADDVINCGGVKFDPANIEAELNQGYHTDQHVYLSRIPDEYRGDGVLANVLNGTDRSKESIVDELDALLAKNNIHARSSIQLQKIDAFPKTKTNKIKRKQLSQAYLDNLQVKQLHKSTNTIESIYCKVFNLESVDKNATFNSLGGDSLTYIRASVEIEKTLNHLPESWENLPLDVLEQQKGEAKKPRFFSKIEIGILLRCLAIVAVVSHHAGVTIVKGGAALLMLIAGYNYVRFQIPKLLVGNSVSVAKSLLINVLLPYWVVVIGFMTLKGYPIHIYDLMFFSGNIFPYLRNLPFQVWFVQAMLQCIVVFSLPLLVSSIREWVKQNKTLYVFLFAGLFYILRILDEAFGWGVSNGFYGGQVSWVAWLFALGALLFTIGNERKIVLTIVVVFSALVFYLESISHCLLVLLGGMLMIWLPQVSVPRIFLIVIQSVSASSLFIYMLHGRALSDSLTAQWSVDFIRIGVGILIGVVVYTLYNFGWTVLAKMKQLVFKNRG